MIVNIPNVAYQSQHVVAELTRSLKDHATAPCNLKTTFNLDFESIEDKRRSI